MHVGAPMLDETIARSRDTGVGVFSIGLFVLSPEGWQSHWDAMLDSAAALGARRAIVLHFDPEPARARELLGDLAARGIGPVERARLAIEAARPFLRRAEAGRE